MHKSTRVKHAEAQDEARELGKLDIGLSIPPERNPFASLVPRSVAVPTLRDATCRGASPVWTALAGSPGDGAALEAVLACEGDWLHVNKMLLTRSHHRGHAC